MIPQAETGFAHLLPLFPYEIKISHSLTPKFFPMFEGQPKGLFALALANTGERFGYYNDVGRFRAVSSRITLDGVPLSPGRTIPHS